MAQRKIIWSLRASADLLSILEFYFHRNGNSVYSAHLLSEIEHIISLLTRHPRLGKKIQKNHARVILRGYYKIFYRIEGGSVLVIAIWDSRKATSSLPI